MSRAASKGVVFEPKSANSKLGPVGTVPTKMRPRVVPMRPFVASTMISIERTCPAECPFKRKGDRPGGCYADAGFTGSRVRELDTAARAMTGDDVIGEEARQIRTSFRGGQVPSDGARGGRDLRLHVSGDVSSTAGARMLAAAAADWSLRGGGSVWSYTHRWAEVPRDAWGEISILASVETPRDILLANKAGYPAAMVVGQFVDDKAYSLSDTSTKVVPCPAQTRGMTCVECRLCLDRDLLALNVTIAFEVHGRDEKKARDVLLSVE